MKISHSDYNAWTGKTFFPVAPLDAEKVVAHLLAKKIRAEISPVTSQSIGVNVYRRSQEEINAALDDLELPS